MESSSSSAFIKRPRALESKESKLQRRTERERARKASKTEAEKERRCNNANCNKETFSVILMITSEDKEKMEVHAFERELRNIADITDDEITEENLLKAPTFSCCQKSEGILTRLALQSLSGPCKQRKRSEGQLRIGKTEHVRVASRVSVCLWHKIKRSPTLFSVLNKIEL